MSTPNPDAPEPNSETNTTPAENTEFNPDLRLPLAIVAYLGPLVIISYMMGRPDSFVRYHTKQGAVLLGLWVVVHVLSSLLIPTMFFLWQLLGIVNLGVFALAVIGIVHVVQNQTKPLPLIGTWAEKLSL